MIFFQKQIIKNVYWFLFAMPKVEPYIKTIIWNKQRWMGTKFHFARTQMWLVNQVE